MESWNRLARCFVDWGIRHSLTLPRKSMAIYTTIFLGTNILTTRHIHIYIYRYCNDLFGSPGYQILLISCARAMYRMGIHGLLFTASRFVKAEVTKMKEENKQLKAADGMAWFKMGRLG